MVTLEITSGRKGSNPGGYCTISPSRHEDSFNGYFKYCFGSKISPEFPFRPKNQPVYEAMTFALARRLGLHTSEGFVLLNNQGNVLFRDNIGERNHEGRRYFLYLN